jgi:hypothetical protein
VTSRHEQPAAACRQVTAELTVSTCVRGLKMLLQQRSAPLLSNDAFYLQTGGPHQPACSLWPAPDALIAISCCGKRGVARLQILHLVLQPAVPISTSASSVSWYAACVRDQQHRVQFLVRSGGELPAIAHIGAQKGCEPANLQHHCRETPQAARSDCTTFPAREVKGT